MKQLILFDNDGTLADSVPRCQQATNQALAEAGYSPVPIGEIAEGMRLETRLRMMHHAGLPDTPEGQEKGRGLAASYHRYSQPLLDETALFPGIPGMLDTLASRDYVIGAVSNNLAGTVDRIFRANGIRHHFRIVLGEDTVDETKPGPGGLLQACRLCGFAPEESVYIGDGPSDPLAAAAAGITSVGILWNTHDPADVTAMGFDHLIRSPADLLPLLGRL